MKEAHRLHFTNLRHRTEVRSLLKQIRAVHAMPNSEASSGTICHEMFVPSFATCIIYQKDVEMYSKRVLPKLSKSDRNPAHDVCDQSMKACDRHAGWPSLGLRGMDILVKALSC